LTKISGKGKNHWCEGTAGISWLRVWWGRHFWLMENFQARVRWLSLFMTGPRSSKSLSPSSDPRPRPRRLVMFDFSCASACNPPNPGANTVKAIGTLHIFEASERIHRGRAVFQQEKSTLHQTISNHSVHMRHDSFCQFLSLAVCQVNMEDIAKRNAEAALPAFVGDSPFP
jgi:hypothetical protein